jgi:hypothetical protein
MTMFNPKVVLINAFVERLQQAYRLTYGQLESHYPGIIGWAGRMALECIAGSDAPYHDVDHTMMVTLVGQDILMGKHLRDGGVSPRDWLHFVIALLCHDIGYVRGVCQDDCGGVYATGALGQTTTLPRGATDASMTPYHIDRGKLFVRERFAGHPVIDAGVIAANIERTRFPVPDDNDHQGTADYPGLVRAADLIGQLADPLHIRKFPVLFYEFEETGTNAQLGSKSPDDLRDNYPTFYWNVVNRYVQDGLRYLRVTQEGNEWIAHLYAHIFAVEHHERLQEGSDATRLRRQ